MTSPAAVTFIVRMTFTPEDRAEIDRILAALTAASRQEPGCITYIPHRLTDAPDTVLIYEQYANDAALDAHRNSAHFKQYAIGGLYQYMKKRGIEDLTALA
jgi:quinol monooxygenase YgiN